MMQIKVQADPFDPGTELTVFSSQAAGAGAVVSFTGIVRDDAKGQLTSMEIEHYPGMTERALASILDEATARWDLIDALIIHRFGSLTKGDVIMMVATAARHRRAAFEAADFLMDYLKSRAPFWKKEHVKGSAAWVNATEEDEAALNRWSPAQKL